MLENLLALIFIYISLTVLFRKTSFTVKIGTLINIALICIMYKYVLNIEVSTYTIISILVGTVMAILHKLLNLDKYIFRNSRK